MVPLLAGSTAELAPTLVDAIATGCAGGIDPLPAFEARGPAHTYERVSVLRPPPPAAARLDEILMRSS